jgi:hypothetical protein
LQSREEIPKFQESLYGNVRGAERMLCAVWAQHPHGKREGRIVRKLTDDAFTTAVFRALADPQGLPEQWMPPVVDREGPGLENMGIM